MVCETQQSRPRSEFRCNGLHCSTKRVLLRWPPLFHLPPQGSLPRPLTHRLPRMKQFIRIHNSLIGIHEHFVLELSRAQHQHNPTIPYLRWLISQHHPTFLFLQQTKSSVQYVKNLLQATSLRYSFGVNAQNLSGGLVVFCWGPL